VTTFHYPPPDLVQVGEGCVLLLSVIHHWTDLHPAVVSAHFPQLASQRDQLVEVRARLELWLRTNGPPWLVARNGVHVRHHPARFS
jgi:hypothetical protein